MHRAWRLVLLLAGCAQDARQEAPLDVPPAPVAHSNVTLDLPLETNATPGGIQLDASGQAGSWFVAFQPFPNGTQQVSAEYRFSAETDGPAGGVLWAAPTVVWGDPDDWRLRFSPFQRAVLVEPAGAFQDARAGGLGASGSSIAGVFAAFAADAPWRVSLEFSWDEGPKFAPSYLATGDGAVFGFGSEQSIPTPGGAGLGMSAYRAGVAGGWNHVEVISTRLQPDEVRQYDFSLPGGHGASGTSTMHGYHVPLVGGSASGSQSVDYIGSLADTAGTLEAQITYAAASTEVRFGHMHLPLTEIPPGLSPAYQGTTWPFPDNLPLPYQPPSS